MALIRFLRDFRSAATDENFYAAGTVVDLPRAAEIVTEGAAEIVTIDSRRGQVKPAEETQPRVSSDDLPFDDTPKGKRKAAA